MNTNTGIKKLPYKFHVIRSKEKFDNGRHNESFFTQEELTQFLIKNSKLKIIKHDYESSRKRHAF